MDPNLNRAAGSDGHRVEDDALATAAGNLCSAARELIDDCDCVNKSDCRIHSSAIRKVEQAIEAVLNHMVSCNMASHQCPPECKHIRPHEPIPDNYVGGAIDECHQVEGQCGYRTDRPMCKCS